MTQSTLEDEDLFGEAAQEMRADVEEHLAAARAELPDPEGVWETEADNVLGVLNGLRSALDVGDAQAELRQAKKWYTMGERADAFDDSEDLVADIEEVAALTEQIDAASETTSDLASTVPELRSSLQEAEENAGEASADAEEEPQAEADGGTPEDSES
jgi:hypothetical protein